MNVHRRIALALSTAILAGCARTKPASVLLVTFDTTRADHLGYAIGRAGLTPNLDRLARKGTWFSDCSAAAPVTLASHASILTGGYPPEHGARDNGQVLPQNAPSSLAVLLGKAGLETHAVVSSFVLDHRFGLNRGFASYDDDLASAMPSGMHMYSEVAAENTADRAIRWLRSRRPAGRPFFLWIHFFDPHAPYRPPKEIAARFPSDPYSGEIAYADGEVGRVLDDLRASGELDRTLVVFTADHGESLGEHEERTHGIFLYQATVHVPLLFEGPGVPGGKRRNEAVSGVDIFPTVAGILGVPAGPSRDGVDLFHAPRAALAHRALYFETMLPRYSFGWAGLRAERRDDLVAIDAPRPELYDLAADPGERHNLFKPAALSEPARALFLRLEQARAADAAGGAVRPATTLSDESKKKLASLGYLSFESRTDAVPADPKDRIEAVNMIDEITERLTDGRYAEAVTGLEAALRLDPLNPFILDQLALTYEQLHEDERALAIRREILRRDPDDEKQKLKIASLLGELGRSDEAATLLRGHDGAAPADADAVVVMGNLDVANRRLPQAEEEFRRALAADPRDGRAVTGLADVLRQAGRSAEATALLRRKHLELPQDASISYNLAVALQADGDVASALDLYRAAVAADPLYSHAWNNLGILLEKGGRRDEAMHCFEKAVEVDSANEVAAVNLGSRLIEENQAARALPLFEQAVRLDPSDSKAAAFRARTLALLGRGREALEAWEPLLEKVPVAWLEIARLSHELGEPARARAALQFGIRRDGAIARQAIAKDPELAAIAGGR